MKKPLIAMLLLITTSVAVASSVRHNPSEAEVERAIDSRLHELLVRLNTTKK